jgi:hypothetical protein
MSEHDRRVLDLIESVDFVGSLSTETVESKCDTGAKRTSIDTELAARLGVSEPVGEVTVQASNGAQVREVYTLVVKLYGERYEVEVSVTDRSAMSYDAILGRDVLRPYLVDPSSEIDEIEE